MVRLLKLLFVPALLIGLSNAAFAVPTMTLDWTPRLPDHLENPGGYFYGQCWADPAGTTPLDLQVRIYDPLGIVVYETVIPGAIYYYIGWVVPQGAPDGVYVYEATYHSVEGEDASNQAGVLVAGAVTGLAAIKFYDLNGNGLYDGGEPFGPGWEMCPTGPVNLPCEFTDAFGVATWFNIPTGTYEICETPQGDYVCTTCGGDYCLSIDVLPNEIAKVTFGNWIPPVEACCFHDGHCEVLLPDQCTTLGGIPQGPGSNCDDPALCPPPLGACCFPDGHCELLTADDCTNGGGIPQGPDTSCDGVVCPPPVGACCLPDGSCQILSEEDCRANGGSQWTEGIDCDGANCPPVATETNSWGRIKANFR